MFAGRMGSQVVVPNRGDEHDHRHLKLMGDLGQIVPIAFKVLFSHDSHKFHSPLSLSLSLFPLSVSVSRGP